MKLLTVSLLFSLCCFKALAKDALPLDDGLRNVTSRPQDQQRITGVPGSFQQTSDGLGSDQQTSEGPGGSQQTSEGPGGSQQTSEAPESAQKTSEASGSAQQTSASDVTTNANSNANETTTAVSLIDDGLAVVTRTTSSEPSDTGNEIGAPLEQSGRRPSVQVLLNVPSFIDRLAGVRRRNESTTAAPPRTGNFDRYLDGILVNLGEMFRTQPSGFDPFHVGNLGPCNNCSVHGLTFVHRSGPANFKFDEATSTVTIDAHVTVPSLYLGCQQCFVNIFHFPLGGKIEVGVWDLSIYAKLSQVVREGETPKLEEFRVDDQGDITVAINGHGVVGPVLDAGVNSIGRLLLQKFYGTLLRTLAPVLIRSQLRTINLPIG